MTEVYCLFSAVWAKNPSLARSGGIGEGRYGE